MIRFANTRSSGDWAGDTIDLNLRSIVNACASYLSRIWGQDLNITCVLRTPEEDKAIYHDPGHQPGVHCFGRGVDISTRQMSSHEVQALCNTINAKWAYDPSRPDMKCALYEDAEHPDSTGAHIHLQTHPATAEVVIVAPTKEGSDEA